MQLDHLHRQDQQKQRQTTTGPAENIELHVIGEALPPLEGLNKIKDIYEGEHPGVKIVIEPYEFESLLQKSTADFTARTGQYDCVMSIYYNLGKYAENGWVVPIDEFSCGPNDYHARRVCNDDRGNDPGSTRHPLRISRKNLWSTILMSNSVRMVQRRHVQ